MPARSFLVPLLVSALAAPVAVAQDTTPPSPTGIAGQDQPPQGSTQPFTDPSQIFSGRSGAYFGFGFGKINGDLYASTAFNTDFSIGPVGLGLQLPLNLLVYSNQDCTGVAHSIESPCTRDEKTYFGVLRRRDWDEPSDFLKFIRYLRYGHKRDALHFQIGQLWGATIGHGTLVNRYSNSLNLDHPKTGLILDVNSTFFGVETLVDSFTNPTLVGGRAYVRPFGETYVLRGFAAGASLIADRIAPLSLQADQNGVLVQDRIGNPVIGDSRPLFAGGLDIEYELLRNPLISLIPYVDANRLAGAGNGLHLGVLTNINVPVPVIDIGLEARLEYRIMGAGYIPEYFDQTYDLGRFQYASRDRGRPQGFRPKLDVAQYEHDTGSGALQGYYGELAFNFGGLLQVGGVYQDYQTDFGASLGLFAVFPKLEIVKLSAYYLRKNFNGLGEALKLDANSLLAASAAYRVFGPLYARFDFSRQWVINPGSTEIQAVDSFNFGLATFLPY